MELRVLKYFLVVAQEENMTPAAHHAAYPVPAVDAAGRRIRRKVVHQA